MFLKDVYIKYSNSFYEKKNAKNIKEIQKTIMETESSLDEKEYEDYLKKVYFERIGCELDFANPETYTEKIQWLKLYGDMESKSVFADKYAVREYIKEKIGCEYLNELITIDGKDCFYDAEDIDFAKLPNRFVMKCNHGSGYNIIIKDKTALSKTKIKRIKKQLNEWLQEQFAFKNGLELIYKNIKPCIIIEKFLEDDSGDLRDYKLFCMDGKVTYIEVDENRYSNHKQTFYSPDWKMYDFTEGTPGSEIDKPSFLGKMIEISETLAKPFCFVRVDLYESNGKLFFGELTFSDASGFYAFEPAEYDLYFGKMIHLDMSKRENNHRFRKK